MSAGLQPRPCPVCGSTDESSVAMEADIPGSATSAVVYSSRKLPEGGHHRLIDCPTCDLVYASPAPERSFIEDAYAGALFATADESAYAAETYRRLARPLLDGAGPDPAVLDIGASDGAFLAALAGDGLHELTGVEPSEESAAAAPVSVRDRIRVEPFSKEALAGSTFRLVTSFQTLEHVSDPAQLTRDARDLLQEGGAILLVAHDRRAPLNRLLRERSPIYDPAHLQLFSQRSIRQLLERSGFVNVKVATVTNRYPLHYWLKLAPIPLLLKRAVLGRLERTRVGAIAISFRPGNIAATGWKPSGS